jgi:hypothetical protein
LESLPANILFILGENVHGHEDIQGVVDPPAYFFFIQLALGVNLDAFGKNFLDELIGDFVVCGFALFFDLAADFHA